MFTAEWLKSGSPVHKEALLGGTIEDALKLARTMTPMARQASGVEPDSIRITDRMTDQAVVEDIGQPHI